MKRIVKKLVSVFLVLSLILSGSVISFGLSYDQTDDYVYSGQPFSIEEFLSLQDYYSGSSYVFHGRKGHITITVRGNTVFLSLDTEVDFTHKKTIFQGTIYSFKRGVYYDDKLIVGEFDKSSGFNIVTFKIINGDNPVLTLLLEDTYTGELTEFLYSIPSYGFAKLLSVAVNNTSDYESKCPFDCELSRQSFILEKLIDLLQPSKRINKNNNMIRSQSSHTFDNLDYNSGTSVTYSNLSSFINSINASPSNWITPNSSVAVVLYQTGWNIYKTSSYFYIMHGVQNSSTERLISITLVSLSNNKPDPTKISASYSIACSCTISYDVYLNRATLLAYDYGLRLEDAIIAIELVGGSTNFYEATKTHNLGSSGTFLKSILIAIADALGVPSAIWNALQSSGDSSNTVDFGSDINQQQLYNGLIRAVANQTANGKYLVSSGHSIGIQGLHYNSTIKTYSSHRLAWKFTAYSLI